MIIMITKAETGWDGVRWKRVSLVSRRAMCNGWRAMCNGWCAIHVYHANTVYD